MCLIIDEFKAALAAGRYNRKQKTRSMSALEFSKFQVLRLWSEKDYNIDLSIIYINNVFLLLHFIKSGLRMDR